MLETRPEDLAWQKGRWYTKGDPEQGAPIEDIVVRATRRHHAQGMEGGLDEQVDYDPPNLAYPYAAYIAVVDVDPSPPRSSCVASSRWTTVMFASTR